MIRAMGKPDGRITGKSEDGWEQDIIYFMHGRDMLTFCYVGIGPKDWRTTLWWIRLEANVTQPRSILPVAVPPG
jgi:hypothetical protein